MSNDSDLGMVFGLAALFSLSACSALESAKVEPPPSLSSFNCDPHKALFPRVAQSSFDGVIVPTDFLERMVSSVGSSSKIFGYNIESFWTPSREEVLTAELRVRAAMLAATSDPAAVLGTKSIELDQQAYIRREIGKIVVNIDSYDAQYAGIVIEGQKRILCNFMRRDEGILGHRLCDWIEVDDGGFWYWEIQYDPETGKCLEFSSNGYA